MPERDLRYATLPLRFFLGATFLYAGLVKVADPGFLAPGSRTYLGTQMQGFAQASPIAPLLTHVMIPLMPWTGIGTIALELAVGAATLLGIYTRAAALMGALFSFSLFLTASWTVQPYFLGSDSIYTVAWITLALVGDCGILTLRSRLPALDLLRLAPPTAAAYALMSRREFLLGAAGGAVAVVWGLAVLPHAGKRSGSTSPVAGRPSSTTPAASQTTPASPSASVPSTPPIGRLTDLRRQGALAYTDPASGDPAVVVDIGNGRLAAFDAVCTHAGCTVNYDPASKDLVCPCHGGTFDPAQHAAVLGGPPPSPLAALKVTVVNGTIYPA